MRYKFECLVCKKMVDVYRSTKQSVPRFCSKGCFQKTSPQWLVRTEYSLLSEQEKAERLRLYFERNVIRKRGCWDWKGAKTSNGYVRMDYARKEPRISVHKYSWMIHNGDVPEGMLVLHRCDNRRCSNPDHLFLGTQADNMSDMKSKCRSASGERNVNAKFDKKKIKEIRKLLEMGVRVSRISKDFNVHITSIYRIKHGKTWKHVN